MRRRGIWLAAHPPRAEQLTQPPAAERPEPTGDPRCDAYLGALAEHLAAVHGLQRPALVGRAGRFLDRFWFLCDVPGLRATAIAQALAAFRRRGICAMHSFPVTGASLRDSFRSP